jgi:hypothetical protein
MTIRILESTPLLENDCDDSNGGLFYSCEFAICELCIWTATVFKTTSGQRLLDTCPVCSSDDYLSFIPLTRDEAYNFSIDQERGLEIHFWIDKERKKCQQINKTKSTREGERVT